jgi:radical SAM superfamily enzyme YgiQ (UPF0313 family)
MNFLLIRPGEYNKIVKNLTVSTSTFPPLGLLYLGAELEQAGHNVKILDYYMEELSRGKLNSLLMSSDAVGINVHTDELKHSIDISNMINDLDSDIPMIIGGPHCTFLPEKSLMDISSADICVQGEGEYVIHDIVKYLQGKKNLDNIHGIYYRNNGFILSGKPLKVINNLDILPFPSRHLVDKYDYGNFPFGLKIKKKVTSMVTSRGCPYHCRFCTRYQNVINGWGFRQRSSDNILLEFEEINDKYGSMMIVDDNFLGDKKRAHKILDGLIKMGINIDLLVMGARADSADKEIYMKMKKAGVKVINYGIESGNQDVLNFYNKNISLQQIQDTVKLARKMNFLTIATFIFGAPFETKLHIENSIKFACSLPLDVALFGPLLYMKGSQLWNEAVESNKISQDTYAVYTDSKKGLGNFTFEELLSYTSEAFQNFYFRPSYILSQIYRSLLRNDYSLLLNGLGFLFRIKRIGI